MDDPFEILREAAGHGTPGYDGSPEMIKDFRAIFLGSPQGKRVFNQILDWCGLFRTVVVKGDPYLTHVRAGERNVAARMMAACVREPVEKPQITTSRGKDVGSSAGRGRRD